MSNTTIQKHPADIIAEANSKLPVDHSRTLALMFMGWITATAVSHNTTCDIACDKFIADFLLSPNVTSIHPEIVNAIKSAIAA